MIPALRAGAVGLYGAYWGLWTFGYVDLHRSSLPPMPRELFGALVIGAPCFLVGAVLGRWWAPAIGLIFVAFVPLADHCVTSQVASDASGGVCFGFDAAELPLTLALTTPCVLAGVVAAKLLSRQVHPLRRA
jgi:hypothetical protein